MSNNATSTPEPGQILAGKYVIEEVLGVGGMGVVVSAKHLQLDQKVAVKYLLPAALLNPEVVERFAREARAAAKIRGEHIARVIDVGQFDDGAPFMVMEHLEGKDLAKILEKNGPLPIEDAIRYLLETCEALAEAHAAKIVHRDLKPSNLFLARQPDKTDIIKVLDFGISKMGDSPSASLTKTSALMGTAFYMSPEQLTNAKGVDHRSDIWSLGVILFELLAGRPPFMGESIPEIIGGILSNRPESIRTLRSEVSVGLEAVIVKCMQSKAADRYQSVAALAAAMGAFARMRDRHSIETTARVLGESVRPQAQASSSDVPSTVAAPALDSTEVQSHVTVVLPSSSPQLVDAAVAPAVPPLTTHGLSTSTITAKPRRTPIGLIVAAVALVTAVAGLTFGARLVGAKPDASPPPAAAPAPVASPQDPAAGPVPPPTAAPTDSAIATTSATTPQRLRPYAQPSPPSTILPSKSAQPAPLPSPPTTPAPAATPSCRVVPYFDNDGNKRFKQSCQ